MQLITILTSTIALIGAASAAPAQGTTRYATLELMSDTTCTAALGELGVYDTDINKCNVIPDGEHVRSVEFRLQTGNCVLHTYSDVTCHFDDQVWNGGECARGEKYYRSYKLLC
ncbi:hypothetical protein N7533_007173 [Penicillium manginii]|uniref:uncharacterized protein n=1 Tax=Penicillium manginii TaxID=203109 RepID=UPI0025494580|nr:uncharacterized protein N7533_007173 [Penicillium manginii]KAJ5750145.1 hypothetical protein N7533_007173 [Penicillium manginii]